MDWNDFPVHGVPTCLFWKSKAVSVVISRWKDNPSLIFLGIIIWKCSRNTQFSVFTVSPFILTPHVHDNLLPLLQNILSDQFPHETQSFFQKCCSKRQTFFFLPSCVYSPLRGSFFLVRHSGGGSGQNIDVVHSQCWMCLWFTAVLLHYYTFQIHSSLWEECSPEGQPKDWN